jgi:site-specific recombinase XerD
MRRLKLPKLPTTQPEPLSDEGIYRVLAVSLDNNLERLRNYSMLMLFLDTGLQLNELITLKQSKIDFVIGEMMVLGKGNNERKAPIGSQAKRTRYVSSLSDSETSRYWLLLALPIWARRSSRELASMVSNFADVPSSSP